MKHTILLTAVALGHSAMFFRSPDAGGPTGGTGGDSAPETGLLPQVQRERSPMPELSGDEKERALRQANAAATTLREQEERRAKAAGTKPRRTPTGEELLAGAPPVPIDEPGAEAAKPTPLKSEGELVTGAPGVPVPEVPAGGIPTATASSAPAPAPVPAPAPEPAPAPADAAPAAEPTPAPAPENGGE